MHRCLHVFVLITLLVSSTMLTAAAYDATPGATPTGSDSLLAELGYPEIRVTTDGTTHDLPTELEAGRYHVVFANQSNLDIDLGFLQLPEGVTFDEAMAARESAEVVFNGGLYTNAGETKGVVLDLIPGAWYANLFMFDPATNEDTDTQIAITVTGEMPEIEDPTGHVEIGLVDMDFVVPDSFEAGPQIWHITNQGQELHHLALDRVPEGMTEDQLISYYYGPSATPGVAATPGELALSYEDIQPVFFGIPLSPGTFNLIELDLEPGTYVLSSGIMLGMVEVVTVE